MKILHLSKDDIGGGAGKAAFRLHQGLRAIGEDSWMLVMDKRSDDEHVVEIPKGIKYLANKIGGRIENLLARWFLDSGMHWDLSLMPSFTGGIIEQMAPDVVNLHWINRGVISVGEIGRLKQPLVWTFHDMWAATSGYHYYGDALNGRFAPDDGDFEENVSENWLAGKLAAWKKRAWSAKAMEIVCPSRWLQRISSQSSILKGKRVHHIPYGLDLSIYRPLDKAPLRKELGLPMDKRLLLFGAASSSADLRKGSDLLLSALNCGATSGRLSKDKVALVVFGHQQSVEEFGDLEVYSLGYLNGDEAVARAYAAVDGFVAPSREDNLPNTVLESLASGVPVLAFGIGGMPDMIEHESTGYLAEPFEEESLLEAVLWLIRLTDDEYTRVTLNCREKAVRQYYLECQAEVYLELYQDLMVSGN